MSIISELFRYPNRSGLISEFRVPVLELCLFLILVAGQHVSADSGNTSVVWGYQLPALQFDPLQERVVVREALSPGAEVGGTPNSLQTPVAKSTGSLTIPAGSIIYYSQDGITTVFDKAGKQIFSADDEKAKMIRTQMGMLPATHIKIIPSGSGVYHLENATYVVYNNDIMYIEIHEKPGGVENNSVDSPADKSSINSMKSPVSQSVQTSVYDAPVIESAVVDNPSVPLGNFFTARWIVPDSPRQTGNFSPTYLSTGLNYQYTFKSYSGESMWDQYDLKPAIEYNYSQNAWFMSTCEYYRFKSSPGKLYSDCVNGGQVHIGDEIESQIEYRELEDDPQYPHPPEWGVDVQIKDLSTGAFCGLGNWNLESTYTFNQLNINFQGDITNLNENTIIGDTTFSPINFPVSPTTYATTSNSQLSHLSVENNWPDKIIFHTLSNPAPEQYTFSMTNIERYANPANNIAMSYPSNINWSGKPKKEPGTASCSNVSKWLESEGWKLVFYNQNQSVTKENFGTDSNGLNDATFHFHFGHGNEGEILMYENLSYLQYSDVIKKWGKKNKWVMIDSCSVLTNESVGKRWGQALNTSHGILGFATEVQYEWDGTPYINKFFEYALKNNQTIMDAYRNATIETAQPYTYGAAVFHNKYQYEHDHFPGHGEVAPDASLNDEPYYRSWQCGKTLNPWWKWW